MYLTEDQYKVIKQGFERRLCMYEFKYSDLPDVIFMSWALYKESHVQEPHAWWRYENDYDTYHGIKVIPYESFNSNDFGYYFAQNGVSVNSDDWSFKSWEEVQ